MTAKDHDDEDNGKHFAVVHLVCAPYPVLQ